MTPAEIETQFKITQENDELKNKYPWGNQEWKERTLEIVKHIPTFMSVLDLGGGFCNLKK